MKRLLVTGGAGFIGSNFSHYWVKHHPQDVVVVLDALTYAGHRENIQALEEAENFTFVQGDIQDAPLVAKLLREHNIDTIVHFAAESHVDRSISGPDAFLSTNVIGTHTLLAAARQYWLIEENHKENHLFHHVSTDEVFGSLEADAPAFEETTAYQPNSPYSASKAASDHFVRAYHHTFGLRTTTSNCSNNYGPWQDNEKLIPLIVGNILLGKQLPIYGDGKNIRDWLYVDDHCRAIDLIIQRGVIGETYNVGGENEWQNIDIVQLICGQIDDRFSQNAELRSHFPHCPAAKGQACASLITFVKDRAGHDRRYAINPEKCHRELGYHPQYEFEQGIELTIDWYLDRAIR